MPRTDRSVTIMTGLIIAAMYVILLIGFSRESYMWRDAQDLAERSGDWPAISAVAKRLCRIKAPRCAVIVHEDR